MPRAPPVLLPALAALLARAPGARSLVAEERAALGLRDSEPRSPRRWQFNKKDPWPYNSHHKEREKFGDRLFKAATVSEATVRSCGGFFNFGGYTWCAKALPVPDQGVIRAHIAKPISGFMFYNASSNYTPGASKSSAKGRRHFSGNDMYDCIALGCPADGKGLFGYSYGIERRDMWSEIMSNVFGVRSKLYDCFAGADNVGPMGNISLLATDLGLQACPKRRTSIGPCYNLPYDKRSVCLAGRDGIFVHGNPKAGTYRERRIESLHTSLKEKEPLSVFLKIDVEGSEWDALEQLLADEEDLGKIRTLEMEVHMNFHPLFPERADGKMGFQRKTATVAEVERRVRIVENLAKKFAVTGSNIDYLHKHLHETVPQRNTGTLLPEPSAAYTTNGYTLDQYMLSFVNRGLL